MEKIRVKKNKIMPYVRLSVIILFLFTLNPTKAFSSIPLGFEDSSLPPMSDSGFEVQFSSLEIDLSQYEISALEEQLESIINDSSNSPSGTLATITNLTTELNKYYSNLNSLLEKIDFYLNTMVIPDIRSCEFMVTHLPKEDWGNVDYNEILSELKQRRATLEQAKRWIESQKAKIDNIYSGLLAHGLAEFDFDMAAFHMFEEFKDKFLHMTEEEILQRINEFKQELIQIQSERKKIQQQLNNAKSGASLWKDEDTPLGRFAYSLYNSICSFLIDIDKKYQEMAEKLDKYVTQEDLLLVIHRDFNKLVDLVKIYDFLFQPEAGTTICYVDKLLKSIRLEDRRQITAQISRDLTTMTSIYANLSQYSDLLESDLLKSSWWNIQRKIDNFGSNIAKLYQVVKAVNGHLLIDDWYEGSLEFRLAQLSIALALQLDKIFQNPSQLLSQKISFPEDIHQLEDMLFNLNEAWQGLSFLKDNGILPQYQKIFEDSLSALQENNTISVDQVQKYHDVVSKVCSSIVTAQVYEQQRLQLVETLYESPEDEGILSSERQQVLQQIQQLERKRDEVLQEAHDYLSQIGINLGSESEWISVGARSPSTEPVTTLVEHRQEMLHTQSVQQPVSEPVISTQAVRGDTGQPTSPQQDGSEPKISTQAVGGEEDDGIVTTPSASSQQDGSELKISTQAVGGEGDDGIVTTQSASSQQDGSEPKIGTQAIREGDSKTAALTTQSSLPEDERGENSPEGNDYQFDFGFDLGQQDGREDRVGSQLILEQPDQIRAQEATQGDLLLTAQGTEKDSPSRSDLNFPDQVSGGEYGDNLEVPGVGETTTNFGNNRLMVGIPPSYDKTGDFPVPSKETINDYIIMIADRLFNNDSPYTKYSEINKELAQCVFRISEEIGAVSGTGYFEIGDDTRSNLEEGFFRIVEERINEKIETFKSLTDNGRIQHSQKPVPAEDGFFQNIGEVKILGLIGLGGEKGSYMVVRAQSDIQQNNKPITNAEGKEDKGTEVKQNQGQKGNQMEEGAVLNSVENINPDSAYIVNIQRAIEMIQSGENIERISQETGLSKEMVKALQEAWKNGTIMKNSSGAYIVVQVEVDGEKRIIVIPADTIIYVTSSKPSEIVKEIIKKVFLKKPQVSDATVNRIFILLILLAVACMAGGITLAVVITRREYRKWLEQIPLPQKPAGKETRPVYTKFVTDYHTYYRK